MKAESRKLKAILHGTPLLRNPAVLSLFRILPLESVGD